MVGSELQKLISSYQRVFESPVDETIVLSKCQHAIGSIEQVEKEMAGKPVRGNCPSLMHFKKSCSGFYSYTSFSLISLCWLSLAWFANEREKVEGERDDGKKVYIF